jgi:glycosyltransferase involved in cell wall biosynthesis
MNGNASPLISVVMNCYNSQAYLAEAIQSVVNQTYHNWELIFWDNQSTDNSALIVQSFNDPRIKYFFADNFENLSKARQLSCNKASGEYLAFIDCDDIWMNDKLALQINEAINNPEVGLVYSKYQLLTEGNDQSIINQTNYYKKINITDGHPPARIFEKLLFQNFIIFSSVLVKKSVFDVTNGFSENFKQNEDYDILLQITNKSEAICINKDLIKYRIHSTNNSYKNAEANFNENSIIFESLPQTPQVRNAIKRNEIRFLLFKIFYLKKYQYIFKCFNLTFILLFFEIIKARCRVYE